MLTIKDLVANPAPILRPFHGIADIPADGGQVIEQVAMCDERWRLPADIRRAHDVLAIVPNSGQELAAPQRVLRALLDQGVTAVAVPESVFTFEPTSVIAAAQRIGLPLLAAAVVPSDARGLQVQIMQRQIVGLRADADQLDRIFRRTASLRRQGKGPEQLLRLLEFEFDAGLKIIEPDDAEWGYSSDFREALNRIRHGQIRTVTLHAQGQHAILHAVGVKGPYQVLIAVRTTPWPLHIRKLMVQVAEQLFLIKAELAHQATERRLQHSAMVIRISILKFLMNGNVKAAARVSEQLCPGLLATSGGLVAVLECASTSDRAEAVEECEKVLKGTGLVVLSPAEERHVIVLVPNNNVQTIDALGPLAGAEWAVGVSGPRPWGETARAYNSAIQALATARQTEKRITAHEGGAWPFATLLPKSAKTWARSLLRPAGGLPADRRPQLLHSARLVLTYGATNAARMLKIDRTTAGKRLTAVMGCMGLRRYALTDRAMLDLAFQLDDAIQVCDEEDTGVPVELHSVLRSSDGEVKGEAQRFLEIIDADTLHFLKTWIESNGSIQQTAKVMSMNRNSVGNRLKRVEENLERPLAYAGSGAHDLLWALIITGHLPVSILQVPDQSV